MTSSLLPKDLRLSIRRGFPLFGSDNSETFIVKKNKQLRSSPLVEVEVRTSQSVR